VDGTGVALLVRHRSTNVEPMATSVAWILAIVAVTAAATLAVELGRAYRRFRAVRLVTCPETGAPAAVHARRTARRRDVGGGRARFPSPHLLALAGAPRLRAGMPPADRDGPRRVPRSNDARTLVRRQVLRLLRAADRRHRGVGAQGRARELWRRDRRVGRGPAPEQLPRLLGTHAPVCWNCTVAETFRRRYPDLVIERRHV